MNLVAFILFVLLRFCAFVLLHFCARVVSHDLRQACSGGGVLPLLEAGESLYFLKFEHNDCFFVLGLKS